MRIEYTVSTLLLLKAYMCSQCGFLSTAESNNIVSRPLYVGEKVFSALTPATSLLSGTLKVAGKEINLASLSPPYTQCHHGKTENNAAQWKAQDKT